MGRQCAMEESPAIRAESSAGSQDLHGLTLLV